MRKKRFKAGDVCYDKANRSIKMVIKKIFEKNEIDDFDYVVGFYNNGEFNTGYSYDSELELWK